MSIDLIKLWHERARPRPGEREFNTQLGCHFEEVAEMVATLECSTDDAEFDIDGLLYALQALATRLKTGEVSARITDRKAFLDAICDQIVTGVGAAHCTGMGITEAVRRVNTSNWSKIVDGEFVRDANGKITKGPNYEPPNLEGLY